MSSHTPGPWFSDERGNVWRRNPADLYENGGGVAGDKPVATAHKGWFGDGFTGYPVTANARLIAAAPELLEALKYAIDNSEFNSEEFDKIARVAIAKATGAA